MASSDLQEALRQAGLQPVVMPSGYQQMLDRTAEAARRSLQALQGGEVEEQKSLADFIVQDLNSPLWSGQVDIARSVQVNPRTAVRSSHGIGKSHLAARVALAYIETHPHSIVVTTAPTSRQVRNVLWRYMRAVKSQVGEALRGRMLVDRYEIAPDWYALGFKGSDNNSDAMQGFHSNNILVIVDEAAGVSESVMEGLEAILTGSGARLLLIGNPTSMSGAFRRAFHEDRHLYETVTISAYDTPNFTTFGITRDDILRDTWQEKITGPLPYPALVDPAWVARQVELHGADSPFVQSRVDAVFPTDADNVLIALAHIEAAMANEQMEDETHGKYAGIDVARGGNDETVICLRQGPAQLHMEAWRIPDLMQTVGRIQHVLEQYDFTDAELRIDVGGLGGGVVDRMKERGYKVVPVDGAAASSDRSQWRNFRQEAWWQLSELYREQMIYPAEGTSFDDEMISQLSDVRISWSSSYNKPVVEDKEATKKRTGRSPDRAEAQLYAYCTPPRPKPKRKLPPAGSHAIQGKASGWHRRKT